MVNGHLVMVTLDIALVQSFKVMMLRKQYQNRALSPNLGL